MTASAPGPAGPDRFTRLPAYLAERTRTLRFGDVPVLLAHPDWQKPAPVVLWLHGRTAHKELDAGRYLRWIRAGIAACAIDLPGHGERADPAMQTPEATMGVLEQAVGEIDLVVQALRGGEYRERFDTTRLGLGGMSAGGMAALRRLCDDHPFACAAVEATTGAFDVMPGYRERHDAALLNHLDPMRHIAGWRPIPLLALHSEADRIVPIAGIRTFIDALRKRYAAAGAAEGSEERGAAVATGGGGGEQIRLITWPQTGAPEEHLGFGRYSNDAKNLQTEFLAEQLLER